MAWDSAFFVERKRFEMAPQGKKAKIEEQGQGSTNQRENTQPPGSGPLQPTPTQVQPRVHIVETIVSARGKRFMGPIYRRPGEASKIQEGAEPGPQRNVNPGLLIKNQKANP